MMQCLDVHPDDLVLDAGCGPGEHSIRVAQAGCRVHAIDISAAALDEARRRAEAAGVADKIRFEQGDLTCLSSANSSFDVIFSWGVVIHIPAAEQALAELTRILKPGGRLALYVTNSGAWDYAVLAAAHLLLRRPLPKLETFSLGRGCWYDMQGSRLWVWRFDIKALTRHLESLGLRQTHRIPGSFTEIQRRLRGPLRQLLLGINDTWYRLNLPPSPCVANLLIFEKQMSSALPS